MCWTPIQRAKPGCKSRYRLIQSATLYNLLSGSYCNDTELHESLALSSIDLQADWHCVIILKLITPSKNSPEGYIYHKKISILVSDLVLELSAPYLCFCV